MCTEIQLICKYKTSIIKPQVHAIWKISEKWRKIAHNIKKNTLQFFKAIYYTKGSNLCSLNLLVMNILRDRVAYSSTYNANCVSYNCYFVSEWLLD